MQSVEDELSNPDTELRSSAAPGRALGIMTALIQAYRSEPGTHFPKKVWVTEHMISAGLRCNCLSGRPPRRPLPLLLDLGVFPALLRPQCLPLLRRGLEAVIPQQEGPDLPPD